jgi:hypothetical protein
MTLIGNRISRLATLWENKKTFGKITYGYQAMLQFLQYSIGIVTVFLA